MSGPESHISPLNSFQLIVVIHQVNNAQTANVLLHKAATEPVCSVQSSLH